MVMTEAMACGTPVVALSRGAVSEIVIDGLTGVLCHHPSELASALADVTRIDPVAVASTSPGGTPSRTSLPATSGHTEAC